MPGMDQVQPEHEKSPAELALGQELNRSILSHRDILTLAPPAACYIPPVSMRRFIIRREVDITGISGTGIILYGVEWNTGGPCDVFWLRTRTTGQYPSMDVVKSTHCYNDNAFVEYVD